MSTPAPKDLSTVPEQQRIGYVMADAIRTLTLADLAARRQAKAQVHSTLGGRKAA